MKHNILISIKKLNIVINKLFPNAKITNIMQLKKGLVNKTYKISINNPNKNLIFRIYTGGLWKAQKEDYLYNILTNKTNVPVPKVLFIDNSKKIFSFTYAILNYIEGQDLGKVFEKAFNKNLAIDSGKTLGKIHSISFPNYGWIIGNQIKPKFTTWKRFIDYDLKSKLSKLNKDKYIKPSLIKNIKTHLNNCKHCLDINPSPVMVHKDYHLPHIIVNKNKISGIIDMEWAIAGHKELDLIKPRLLMFSQYPKMEKYFIRGYKETTKFSINKQRLNFYELLTCIGMVNFARQMKHKDYHQFYIKKIKEVIEK